MAAADAAWATGVAGLAVEVENRGSVTVLRVRGDRDIAYSTRQLSDPDRFVVELRGVIRSYSTARPTDKLVRTIRVGQVRLHPEPVSEVVVDLREPSTPSIGNTGTGLEVFFLPREAPAVSNEGALFLSLEVSELSTARGGGRAAFDWMRAARPRLTYLAGISSARLADSEWTVARGGAFSKVSDRVSFRGDVHLGAGRRDSRGFDYRMIEAGVTWEIAERRLYLDVEDRYLDIDTTHGNLVQAGFTFLPHRRLSSKVAFIRSTGGNTESDFVTARLDYFAGRLHFLGGFASGRTRPEVVEVLGGDAARLEQFFAGMAFPLSRTQLTVVLDLLTLDDVERGTLTVSLRVPRKGAVKRR